MSGTAAVRCPRCHAIPSTIVRTRDEIAGELATRDAFFARRLQSEHRGERLRDLNDALLARPADVLRCDACGILVRDDAPEKEPFRNDPYDDDELEALHAEHLAAFRDKSSDYRPLLGDNARVIEVGSYVAGFLAAAREWNWNATGIDIGVDTSRFTRARGFDVQARPLEQCAFAPASFDGVFIWNCFEQLPDPQRTLAESRRILRDGGVLVIRVPDAAFYLQRHDPAVLAYNGLLGWPHRFGFDADTLAALAADHGFTPLRVLRAPDIQPFHDALRDWAQDEANALQSIGGWIEVTLRL